MLGGIPLAIPPFMQKEAIEALAYKLDGLILSGGPDMILSIIRDSTSLSRKVCSIEIKRKFPLPIK